MIECMIILIELSIAAGIAVIGASIYDHYCEKHGLYDDEKDL